MVYHNLRTVAFRFAEDASLSTPVYVLPFPESWMSALLDLQAEAYGRDREKVNLPLWSLNHAVAALVPDVLINAHYSYVLDREAWLYSTAEVDPQALFYIFPAWIHTAFSKAPEQSRLRVLEQMAPSHLQWELRTIDLAAGDVHRNGTASLPSEAFRLLPAHLASLLSQPGVTFDLSPETLRFVRIASSGTRSGIDLISWPPLQYERNGKNHNWSVLLSMSVQTVPFQDYPSVQFNWGVRRWVSAESTANYRNNDRTSVAVRTEVPWLPGLHNSSSFQIASIQRQRRGENDEWGWAWVDDLTTILDRLQVRNYPQPSVIMANPAETMNLYGSPNALAFYRNGMKPPHRVGTGLLPGDRYPLTEQLESKLAVLGLGFVPLLERVSFRPSREGNPFAGMKADLGEQAERRRRVAAAVPGGKLTLEIRHQSSKIRHALLEAIDRVLGFQFNEVADQTCTVDDLTLTLKPALLGALGADLGSAPGAEQERVRWIANELPLAEQRTLALIELDGPEAYWKRVKEDPKQALRWGLARTNRLTQFLTPPLEGETPTQISHRAQAALLDALRQLGSQATELRFPALDLPQPLRCVGFWLLGKGNERVPVLVMVDSRSLEVRATASGLGNWRSYADVLLALANRKGRILKSDTQIADFIKDQLDELAALAVTEGGGTLFMCDAANVRRQWKWLQDREVQKDRVALANAPAMPIGKWPGLRIARIRYGSETPQWYAVGSNGYGFSRGTFQIGERVFASTSDKPKQQTQPIRQSKVSPTSSKGKTYGPRPSRYAWNPGIYEITLACLQPDDQAWPWAALVHELRSMHVQYDEATSLPLPLHLAKRMAEYWTFDEEEDEE